MHGHHHVIGESAESRLLLTITELSARVSCTREPHERARLRATIETLRKELLSLIEKLPVPTEAQIEEANRIQSDLYSRLPLSAC